MKLVLDLQGAQCQSRQRGIGRYTLALTRALLAEASETSGTGLLLNARFDKACDALIGEFRSCPRHVFDPPDGIAGWMAAQSWGQRAAARAQRCFLESLPCQVIWYSSVFEGYVDDVLLPDAPPEGRLSVATLYDLIPLSDPGAHLAHPRLRAWYEGRLALFKKMHGLFAISEWVRRDAIERLGFTGDAVITIGSGVEAHFRPSEPNPEVEQELRIRLGLDGPYVLYGGGFDERKNVDLLVRAFAALPRALRETHRLLLVGGLPAEEQLRLKGVARRAGLDPARLMFTGYVNDEVLVRLYGGCALFVFPSLQEGFGLPPLEAMASGAPVIASDTTSLPEVLGRNDMLFDPRRVASLVERMREVLESPVRANELRSYGLTRAAGFSWDRVAARARDGLLALQARHQNRRLVDAASHDEAGVLDEIAALPGQAKDSDIAAVAQLLAASRPREVDVQWLVDVSEIASRDLGTGVQRVVRKLLVAWLATPPSGVRIEPVYVRSGRFHYARRYTQTLLGRSGEAPGEPAVEVRSGDHFIGLDWTIQRLAEAVPQLEHWRRHGVATHFLVHDLLPLALPEYFHPHARLRFEEWWRRVVRLADQLLCVSGATANAVQSWLGGHVVECQFGSPPAVVHFALGVDDKLTEVIGVPRAGLVKPLAERPTFLMVGTLEPRKGHAQALEACGTLWRQGEDFNLLIVGRHGWMMEDVCARLVRHEEYGQRLFWLEDAEDAELEAIYRASSVLLAASFGEGFGLPPIEAARRGLPVIARDIPVFREVLGDYAHYVEGADTAALAAALAGWLRNPTPVVPPASNWRSWAESAASLAARIAAA